MKKYYSKKNFNSDPTICVIREVVPYDSFLKCNAGRVIDLVNKNSEVANKFETPTYLVNIDQGSGNIIGDSIDPKSLFAFKIINDVGPEAGYIDSKFTENGYYILQFSEFAKIFDDGILYKTRGFICTDVINECDYPGVNLSLSFYLSSLSDEALSYLINTDTIDNDSVDTRDRVVSELLTKILDDESNKLRLVNGSYFCYYDTSYKSKPIVNEKLAISIPLSKHKLGKYHGPDSRNIRLEVDEEGNCEVVANHKNYSKKNFSDMIPMSELEPDEVKAAIDELIMDSLYQRQVVSLDRMNNDLDYRDKIYDIVHKYSDYFYDRDKDSSLVNSSDPYNSLDGYLQWLEDINPEFKLKMDKLVDEIKKKGLES